MSGYLAPAPPGLTPNWDDKGWAPTIRNLVIALLVFDTLFVTIRIYTRVVLLKSFSTDDCMCICAYAMVTSVTGLTFKAIQNGFGRHAYDIPASKGPALNYSYFILGLLPGPIYFFIKMTFLLTYARIFSQTKYMRHLIWIGIGVCTAFYVGDFLYDLFQCSPVEKAWKHWIKGHCATEAIPGGPTGIFNVISDFYILILPMPMVWTLHMSWQRRLRLAVVFSMGFFTCATSIIRLAETIISSHIEDRTFAAGAIFIWSNLEWSVGFMVACMIVCPTFWDRIIRLPFVASCLRISSAYRSILFVREESATTCSDRSENRAYESETIMQNDHVNRGGDGRSSAIGQA